MADRLEQPFRYRPVERNDITRTETSNINGGNTQSNLLEKAYLNKIKQIEEQQKLNAITSDPTFPDNLNKMYADKEVHDKSFNDLGDLITMISGGLIKTPSEFVRLGYDIVNGNPIFTDEDGKLGSWWKNNGIMPDDSNTSNFVNALFDILAGEGLYKFVKWGNTYKLISPSTEYDVYSKPFSRYVYKVGKNGQESIDYMKLKETLPNFEPAPHIGYTLDGLPVFQQRKLIQYPSKNITSFIKDAVDQHFFPTKIKGYDETLLYNPITQIFMGDLPGNLGIRLTNPLKIKAFDASALNYLDQFAVAAMKKGGKLIPKCKNGFVLKFQDSGIFPVLQESDIDFNSTLVTNDLNLTERNKQLTEKRGSLSPEAEETLGFLYDVVSIFDPTGISSWPDVYKAIKQAAENNEITASDIADIGISIISALPMIGKVTAPAKMAKLVDRASKTSTKILPKVNKYLHNFNKPIDTFPELFSLTRGSTAKVQDLTSKIFTNPWTEAWTKAINPGFNKGKWFNTAFGVNTFVNGLNTANTVSDIRQVAIDDFSQDYIRGSIEKAWNHFVNLVENNYDNNTVIQPRK